MRACWCHHIWAWASVKPSFFFLQLPANHNHAIQWRYKRGKFAPVLQKPQLCQRQRLKFKKHLWVLPGAISFCLFVCLFFQIRTACYGSQLIGGVLSRKPDADVSLQQLGKRLLLFSAQLSHCRTVLRLFDDLSMLAYSHSYGTGVGVTAHFSVFK